MTEPKTMQLAPADWKQLCLLNAAQLHGYIEMIPPHNEGGASALTDDALREIDAHLERGRALLRAWRVARMPAVVAEVKVQTNGADPVKPKGKGGWPKGRKRTPQPPKQHPTS